MSALTFTRKTGEGWSSSLALPNL